MRTFATKAENSPQKRSPSITASLSKATRGGLHPQPTPEKMNPAPEPRARPSSCHSDFAHVSLTAMPIQRKPVLSTPGDVFEREADVVADRVMRMAEPPSRHLTPASIQRKCAQCDDEEKTMIQPSPMPAENFGVPADAGAAIRAVGKGGVPLSSEVRSYFEPRFRHDFSTVRVHADAEAAKGARTVRARAYTVGHDIVFGAGQYAPATMQGKRLLAHELTHVIQQESALLGGQGVGHNVSGADRYWPCTAITHAGQSKQIQRAPDGSSNEPSIAGTPDEDIEMWKDVIAHRHHQEKGPQGEITLARMKIVDKDGRTVVNILAESDKSLHAEEKAISAARMQIGQGKKIVGGKIIFVTDSAVCDEPGRCRAQIKKLAEDLDVEEARATVFSRAALLQEKGPLATPKATAKKVQMSRVEGLELISSTETIYKRSPPPPSGGTPGGGTARSGQTIATPRPAPTSSRATPVSGEGAEGAGMELETAAAGRQSTSAAAPTAVATAKPAVTGEEEHGTTSTTPKEPEKHEGESRISPSMTINLSESITKLALESIKNYILIGIYRENEARQKADDELIRTEIKSLIAAKTDKIVDMWIDYGTAYANIKIGTFLTMKQYVSGSPPTPQGGPGVSMIESVDVYNFSILIDVEISGSSDTEYRKILISEKPLEGEVDTFGEVITTQAVPIPRDSALARDWLKARIAEVDAQIAKAPPGAAPLSLQLFRWDLQQKLLRFGAD
jgi:Domain of unknown function (DUF4157)